MQCISSIYYPLVFSAMLVIAFGCAIKKNISKHAVTDSLRKESLIRKQETLATDSAHTRVHSVLHTYDSTQQLTYTFARPVTIKEIQDKSAPIIALSAIHRVQKHQSQEHKQASQINQHQTKQYDSTGQITRTQTLESSNTQIRRRPAYAWIIYVFGIALILFFIIRKIIY